MTPSPRELLPTAGASETWAAIRGLMRPRLPHGLLALLTLVAATVAGLIAPVALGRLVDIVVDGGDQGDVVPVVLVLVAAAVAGAVLTALGESLVAWTTEPALATLRERVMDRALRLPLDLIERSGSGDIVARLSGDVAAVALAVRNVLPAISSAGLTVALTLVGLASLDWRFALAGLCATPIQFFTLRWYLRASSPVYASERIAQGDRAQSLLESIGGADTVRAFGLGRQHLAGIETSSSGALQYAYRATRLRTFFFGRLNAAEFVGLSAILIVGFYLVRSGEASLGEATAAALFFMRLFDPINTLLFLVDDAQQALAGLARLVGVADMPLQPQPTAPGTPRDASIEVIGVRHAYVADHEVLDVPRLRIAPGEQVALVGASGAGKTTLAKLIAGIHAPTAGEIRIGGIGSQSLGETALRRLVALVTQDTHVFAGTLADDLRLARPEATDADLEAVMHTVGADAWLGALPDGLQTVVGDSGHRLTAMQVQQLALARVLLVDAPIVILDEATAEAGSASARQLDEAAGQVLRGRTGIIVAHRLVQAAEADRIIVMDDGRIVESGTHAELTAREGPYAALWAAWASGHGAPA